VRKFTDAEIIECLRERKGYVVRYLWDKYLPMVRFMVVKMGGTAEDAKDIFQEGLIVMIEKLDDSKFSISCKFKTMFYSICENLWKTALKKRHSATNYFAQTFVDTEQENISESIDNNLFESIFQAAFDTLDPVGKKILLLYWENFSPCEIAVKLGYSYGYVRKKKCQSQAELIEKVCNHPDYRKIKISEMAAEKVVY
jgi:RNA polymerase sigma factor (sigma-70 family)